MASSRKRKDRSWTGSDAQALHVLDSDGSGRRRAHAALYIQAHEADVVHNSRAKTSAASLETRSIGTPSSGLMRLGYEDHEFASAKSPEVWVDRYDVRLLLDPFHTVALKDSPRVNARSASPGWEDLPSDSEDTFFFSPQETEEYRRDKKRRLNDRVREERVRARMEEDGEVEADVWGGSDEEPDDAVKQVMHKTANLIATAPNPTQMEMKILVDFGEKQPAFAFLKGRWKRRWGIIRASTNQEIKQKAEAERAASNSLGGLTGYGDSDDDSEDLDS